MINSPTPNPDGPDEPTLDELLDLLQSNVSPLLNFNKQRIRNLFQADRIKLLDEVATAFASAKQSIAQHTVPEGRGLVTRHYVMNTLDFELERLRKEQV